MSRRNGRFKYKKCINPRLYVKVTATRVRPCHGAKVARPIRQGVWWGAPVFASWQGCIPMAITFAYELRLERLLYQNRSFRRDKDNSCRSFSKRGSFGGVISRIVFWVQNLSISNTTSACEMISDGDGPNFKDVHIDNTKLFYVDHSPFEAILIKLLTVPKFGVNTCPPVFRQNLDAEK